MIEPPNKKQVAASRQGNAATKQTMTAHIIANDGQACQSEKSREKIFRCLGGLTDAEDAELRRLAWRAEKRGRVPRSRRYLALRDRLNSCRYCGSKPIITPGLIKLEVWMKAVPSGYGGLCRACLQKRLARRLIRQDWATEQ